MKNRTYQLPEKGIYINEQWASSKKSSEGPTKVFVVLQNRSSVFAKDSGEVASLLEPIPPEILQWLLESPNDWGPVKPPKLVS